jgi:hypothetical protein
MTRVLAIVVAFNEADVLDATLRALVAEGCDVHVIDHGSTDGTGDVARAWLGRGVVGVERFPEDAGFPARNADTMVWRDLLTRRAQVAREYDHDWFVNHDADEFREAPWPGLTLAEGLARAEALGFNAVNFRVFNFRPTGEDFRPGDDPREALVGYEPADPCDTPQVKAYRRPADGEVDILHAGGHDIRFAGRRVCPIPFILRHYPIRSAEHGRRKVLGERLPRFAAEERAAGWHVQYDALVEAGARFTWDPAELRVWDPAGVRAELLAGAAEALLAASVTRGTDLAALELSDAALRPWVAARLGAPLPEPRYRRARGVLDRLLRGADPVATVSAEADVAPVVLELLGAVAAQVEVAGEVVTQALTLRLIESVRAALPAPLPYPGARGFVAYVDAGEAVACPELVGAFARAFGPADDATLVLGGCGWSEARLGAELGPVVELLGLDDDGAPDLLATNEVPEDLAARVHAVLSERRPVPVLGRVPHLGRDGAAALRELAGAEVPA